MYAGGDDVLAFVPLHTVLTCAKQLNLAFSNAVGGFQDGGGNQPSLSVGVAIAHHLNPLEDALKQARDAEAKAKQVPGKNALTVSVDKRGGPPVMVTGGWCSPNGGLSLYERLDRFTNLHRRDLIPDGAAFELRDLQLRLADPNSSVRLGEAIQKEALRILSNKRSKHGGQEMPPEVREVVGQIIQDPAVTVGQLADELIVARLLAETKDLAEEPLVELGGTYDHLDR